MSVRRFFRNRLGVRRFPDVGRFRGYDLEGIGLLVPVIGSFLLISVLPILYGFWLSFQSGLGATNLQWVGGQNYVDVLNDDVFWSSVGRGVFFAVYTVVLQIGLGVSIALALNHRMKFSNLIRALVFLPYMIPTIAVASIIKWMLQNEVGVVNYLLRAAGLISTNVSWFSEGLAMHSVVWASTWKWTVFVILIVLARLQSIDPTLYEAAKTNGASLFQQFMDVTLPQIKSIIMLLVLLRTIWQFSKFEMIWLLTQGGPFDATTTLVIFAYEQAFNELAFGRAAAVTTVIFLILLAFALVYFNLFNPEEEVEVAQ